MDPGNITKKQIYQRTYYENNKEILKQKRKNYYIKNREKIIEKQKKYQQKCYLYKKKGSKYDNKPLKDNKPINNIVEF